MNFNSIPEFSKELARLSEKYKSLPEDFDKFKRVISVIPCGNGKHFNVINRNDKCIVLKARLFCKYLKGSSLRIIYSYIESTKTFDFIEIYFKGEKGNENYERIRAYLSQLK